MEKIKLHNMGLLRLIRGEIKSDYELGLHNVSLRAYLDRTEENLDDFALKYKITEDVVTHSLLAESILQKGLAVPYNTLRCTVTFIGNKESIEEEIFDYLYRTEDIDKDEVCTIITSIPRFITIDNKDYFVGKITKKSSGLIEPTVSTDIFFKKHLPKEFIYGYYIKNIEKNVFSNDLEFVMNRSHVSKMNRLERSNLYQDIIKREKISMDLLEAIEKEDLKYRSGEIHTDLCVRNAIREKQKLKK